MTKKILFLIFILLLVGCRNKYHGLDFDALSMADCAVKCSDEMNNRSCWEAVPSYSESYVNGEHLPGKCSCFIRECKY